MKIEQNKNRNRNRGFSNNRTVMQNIETAHHYYNGNQGLLGGTFTYVKARIPRLVLGRVSTGEDWRREPGSACRSAFKSVTDRR